MAYPAKEIMEPWIGAHSVELGNSFEPGHQGLTFVVGPVQPLELVPPATVVRI